MIIAYYAFCKRCSHNKFGDQFYEGGCLAKRFTNKRKRDDWAVKHAETVGHTVIEGERYEDE
jgi:hypothetical protein